MINLQEQVKKTFRYRINCSSDLKNFANPRPSASNFKSFSRSLEQFVLTVGQNNFVTKYHFFKFLTMYIKKIKHPKCVLQHIKQEEGRGCIE